MASAEDVFLKYALPCAFILRDKGEITQAQLDELHVCATSAKPVRKEILEKVFHAAFEKIKRRTDSWDTSVVRRYFREQHNDDIDCKEGYYATCGELNRELSKVHLAEVTDIKDRMLAVSFDGKTRNVFKDLVPDAKIGDKVYIHFFFAVEKP